MKDVMFGTMKGEYRRGRPWGEWLDDIKEWCGEEIQNTQQEGEGSWHVENDGEDGIGHLRALSHGAVDGWITHTAINIGINIKTSYFAKRNHLIQKCAQSL